jgi:hypothetical protein
VLLVCVAVGNAGLPRDASEPSPKGVPVRVCNTLDEATFKLPKIPAACGRGAGWEVSAGEDEPPEMKLNPEEAGVDGKPAVTNVLLGPSESGAPEANTSGREVCRGTEPGNCC